MYQRGLICILLIVSLALFAACSEKDDDAGLETSKIDNFTLLAAYPYQGMQQVPVHARVHLAFSAPIDPATVEGQVSFVRLLERGGTESVDHKLTLHRSSVELTPLVPLRGNQSYRVRLRNGVRDFQGRAPLMDGKIQQIVFQTKPDRPDSSAFPTVAYTNPAQDEVLDISTFRIAFSEPIVAQSVIYGQSVHLRVAGEDAKADDDDDDDQQDEGPADEPGELVAARVFVQGNLVVIDPLDDLNPKLPYELTIEADPFEYPDADDDESSKADDDDDDDDDDVAVAAIHDLNGAGLQQAFVWSFYPQSTEPRRRLITDAWPSAADGDLHEALDPEDMPLSPLTGRPANTMIADSKLLGESVLYVGGALFSELGETGDFSQIPLTIRAGEKLITSSMSAMLGGKIPAGLVTGPLTIEMLSDVSGYLRDSRDYVGNTEVLPALTLVMDISLTAEDPTANSNMTQQILGVELVGVSYVREDGEMVLELMGYSELKLAGESIPTTISLYQIPYPGTPQRKADRTPPQALSSLPQQSSKLVPVESPVIVFFNEALDPTTIEFVKLYNADEEQVPCAVSVDGAKVALRPIEPLEPSSAYGVFAEPGLCDLAGNALTERWGTTFSTNAAAWSYWPPKLGTMDVPNEYGSTYPCNLWPTVFFTQVMNRETMYYGDTVLLYDIDAGTLVNATSVVDWRKLVIIPDEPLTPGRRYRLQLSEEIRSYGSAQLDTDNDLEPGGEDYRLDFTAVEPTADVELFLHADPISDTDGNGFFDDTETPTPENQIEILSALIVWPSYVSGEMVSFVRGLAYDRDGEPYLDISLSSGIVLYATSTSMGLTMDDDDKSPGDPGPVGMGPITIDVFQTGMAPVVEADDGLPQMNISMMTYFTVRNGILNALLEHELALEQTGRMFFNDDGRMEVLISGQSDISMLGGLLVLPSDVKMRAVSPPPL
ncbi:MAG: Ig-like domain-containing protein [Candidatus Alcyoniella australis]|nr:Ig-like domain-containing protein [Candidatus Alcyoniella australis]